MADLKIIYKDITDIQPYPNNPRDNAPGVDAVAASIKEFGFKVPIIIDKKGEIVAGHTRILAAEQLGLEKVPCIIADDLTEAQIKAFRIADNQTASLTGWNEELLSVELDALADMNFDLSITGFSDIELEEFFNLGRGGGYRGPTSRSARGAHHQAGRPMAAWWPPAALWRCNHSCRC